MSLDISDFTCPLDHLGRFELPEKEFTAPQIGLALALIGFTPIRVETSKRGRWLDIVGLSPSFSRVAPGTEIPVYTLELIEHDDPEGRLEPSIEYAGRYFLQLHLAKEVFDSDEKEVFDGDEED